MKIGLYIGDILFRTGGTESYTAHIVSTLQSIYDNPEIILVSEKYYKDDTCDNIKICESLNTAFGTCIKPDKFSIRLVYANKNTFLDRFLFEKRLNQISKNFDIFFNCSMNPYTFSAKKNIVIVHFPPYKKINSPFVRKFPFFSPGALYQDFKWASSYDLYISNSNYTKSWLNKIWHINGKKSVLLYPAVSFIKNMGANKSNYIMICSRIEPSKDIDILISAFLSSEYLKNKISLFILGSVIAENTAYSQKIKTMISFCKNISFVENPDRKTIEYHYSRSKIFWHAKGFSADEEKNPYALEHFGITTVEAMSAGCVPVVINKGGQKEIVENGINGFLWDNPEQLIEKTIFLIENSDQYASMSKAAKESVQRYSLNEFTKNFDNILKSKL